MHQHIGTKVVGATVAGVPVSIDEKGVLRLGPDAHAATLDQLKSELLSEIEKKPDLQVALSADKLAPLGEVIKVMDVAKEVDEFECVHRVDTPSGMHNPSPVKRPAPNITGPRTGRRGRLLRAGR